MRTIKRDIVGAFIISADGKLLLGKTGVYKGSWCVPGGGVDEGETKPEALKREILEETGIDIDGKDVKEFEGALTGESEKTLRGTGERVFVEMVFYNYTIKLSENANEVQLKTDDDFVDPKWYSKAELKDLDLSPPTATTLQKIGYL